MSKSGKKKITSVFKDFRATKCSLCGFFLFVCFVMRWISTSD